MNSVDRVLNEELSHLVDRLASSVPDAVRGRQLAAALRIEAVREIALQEQEEGAYVGGVLAAVGVVVGERRRQPPSASRPHERLEADVIDRLFQPLAHLHLDTGGE